MDLFYTLSGGELWAIEIRRNIALKIERGFHSACVDLNS